MKFHFYAAALLALGASAVTLENTAEVEAFDVENDIDLDYAQTDLEGQGKGENVVKVNIPECQGKPDPDALIMEAVNELGTKSADMAKALKLAFARSARLAATRTMEVKGCISLTPKITEPTPAPKASTVNIEGGGSGCCGSTQLQITPPACP